MTDERRYYAASGARFSDEAAHVLGTAFEAIHDLTPEAIVEVAKEKSSPIHDYFDWDDKVAAGKWRHRQAYAYLRNLRIEIVSSGELIRAFHPVIVKKDAPSSYVLIGDAAQNEAWWAQIMDRMSRELVGYQNRYRQYSTLREGLGEILDGPVQEAIDQLKELPVGT